MPSENRVGGDDGGDLMQPSTPQAVPTHGEPPPLLIGQLQAPPPQLTAQDPVFFDQIRHGLLLLAPPPPGKRHQHEPEPRALHDRGSLHDRHRLTIEIESSAQKWDTTGHR
jgi:hypothetical protein